MRGRPHFIWRDERGSILIETALILPLIALMIIGAFDVSRLVARQTELQETAAEVAAISMASTPDDAGLAALESIAIATAGVSNDKVDVTRHYRCDSDTTLHDDDTACGEDDEVSTLVKVRIRATYTPAWTNFGFGSPVELDVSRLVQVG